MESTPLMLAHSHARKASIETHKANPVVASEEHDLAAGEFANAAKTTGDVEALRTLTLLEQHHQKLAELLKFRPQDGCPQSAVTSTSTPPPQPASPSKPLTPKTLESSPRHISHHSSPIIPSPHRDLTSSIASNLASARGIPSNRQRRGNQIPASLSPQLAEGKVVIPLPRRSSKLSEYENVTPTNPDEIHPPSTRPSALSPSRARVSTPDITTTSPTRQTPMQAPPAEDSFSRFYAAFSPFLSKLSAPLAFAGLPLNPDPPVPLPSEKSPSNPKSSPPLDPDLTRLFSRAALRAVEHGNPAESFYVVPTTGGTMSYAGMLANTKHGSHLTASDEEFVDARETMQPNSPGLARRGRASGIRVGSSKTMEELQVENETLKAVAIDLGDRLRAFEMGAQRSSMALHMSMRAMQSPSASTANAREQGKGGGEKSASEQEIRIKELEVEVRDVRKEMKKLARENQKLVGVVERYRERWEILKDGARERMRGDGKDGEGRS